jgi:hypothetical protein
VPKKKLNNQLVNGTFPDANKVTSFPTMIEAKQCIASVVGCGFLVARPSFISSITLEVGKLVPSIPTFSL